MHRREPGARKSGPNVSRGRRGPKEEPGGTIIIEGGKTSVFRDPGQLPRHFAENHVGADVLQGNCPAFPLVFLELSYSRGLIRNRRHGCTIPLKQEYARKWGGQPP